MRVFAIPASGTFAPELLARETLPLLLLTLNLLRFLTDCYLRFWVSVFHLTPITYRIYHQTIPSPNLGRALLHRPYIPRIFGVLSFLAKVLIKETGFLISEYFVKKPVFSSLFPLASSRILLVLISRSWDRVSFARRWQI